MTVGTSDIKQWMMPSGLLLEREFNYKRNRYEYCIRDRFAGNSMPISQAEFDVLKLISKAESEPATPEHPHYVYIIRERTEKGWEIVGNIVYPTFNDAREKMKKLIKDCRQLEPDYNANNLNIIQVKVKE